MIPGRIANATRVLGAPPGWTDATDRPCCGLPIRDEVQDGMHFMTSSWEPTPDEIERLAAGARLYLTIAGRFIRSSRFGLETLPTRTKRMKDRVQALVEQAIHQAMAGPWEDARDEATSLILGLLATDGDASGSPRMCKTCHAPRSAEPCHKCGGPLSDPCDGWEWPELPPIDRIRELACEVGYAVGVHGSLERDLDLIAAPWADAAVSAEALAEHVANGINGRVLAPEGRPLGRWSCNIQIDGWFKLIDLSVAPTLGAQHNEAEAEQARLAAEARAESAEAALRGIASYISEHTPRCYQNIGGAARRTAFAEIEQLLSAAPSTHPATSEAAREPAEPSWGWWAGRSEEWFDIGGPFATREEAIAVGHNHDPDQGFWIAEALQQRVRFSAEQLIDAQYVENDDYFDGEHGDPDRTGDSVAADGELQALLDAWTAKHQSTFVAPNLFANQRNLEWIGPAPDEDTDTIVIGGRTYRKFIRPPGPVTDGTLRCFACGQIDEPEHHEDALCPAINGAARG